MRSARILVVDDDRLIRTVISERLTSEGLEVIAADCLEAARTALKDFTPDVALLDIRLPDGVGTDLLQELVSEGQTSCIMMTAHATVELAVEALRMGAWDFLEKPFSRGRLEATLRSTLERTALQREVRAWREMGGLKGKIIAESPAMKEVLDLVEQIAPADHATVLIEGETGTGKGVIARSIHELSPRAAGPFVTVTCSALAESIMESELFGHEKGAFTDARTMKLGLVEIADGGTLFLDEIGELSPPLQGKLLRFIEEKTFRRVGGTRDLTVDARVVAATNRELEEAVEAGEFRADLYYRLRVVDLRLPPLRDRPGDISRMVTTFIDEFNRELGRSVQGIDDDAMERLRRHPWPGNVRELRNLVERCVLLARGDLLTVADLPVALRGGAETAESTAQINLPPDGLDLEALERSLVEQALLRAEGNRTEAGALLGLSRHQIRNRLAKYGLDE
jgi:DNA-binding NtrC family response regulator